MASFDKKRWGSNVRIPHEKTDETMYLNIEEKKWIEYKEAYRKGLIKEPKYISFCKIRDRLR